jgi:hypothetical protein
VFNSQVLEVAAGLIFVYLVLSTACSGINEVIARVLQMREKALEDAIRQMLRDPQSVLTSRVLQSHLIAASAPSGRKPAYISSRNFALSLFDILAPPVPGQSRTIQDLKNGIKNIPDANVQASILSLLDSAQGNVEVARARVEHWYDDTMERLSGWYKRSAQKIIFALGLALCILLNADTLMLVRELWNDDAVRSSIVSAAQERVKTPTTNDDPGNSLRQLTAYIRAENAPPIGWVWNKTSSDDTRGLPEGAEWIWKAIGILISTVAVGMGTPFWFDLLNKVVNLRLTGDPPPDSRQTA